MAFRVKDDFKAGAPISQVPASWFNSVAKFLNNLVGGFGIRVHKQVANRPVVELDLEKIKDLVLAGSEESNAVNFGTEVNTLGSDAITADRSGYDTSHWDLNGFDDAAEVFVVSRVDKPMGGVAKLFFRKLFITADGHVGGVGQEVASVEVI